MAARRLRRFMSVSSAGSMIWRSWPPLPFFYNEHDRAMKPAPGCRSIHLMQSRHDHGDALRVPSLHGLVIRAQSSSQAAP